MNTRPLFVDDALQIVLEQVKPFEKQMIPLEDCDGYVLAEDIFAAIDLPHFSRSMMDGYAIQAADTASANRSEPITLTVIDTIMAGEVSNFVLKSGQAVRIMTGAPIPAGADAVCRFEQTKELFDQGHTTVSIVAPVAKGESIGLKGEDIQKGTKLLAKGMEIGLAEMSMLATFGFL